MVSQVGLAVRALERLPEPVPASPVPPDGLADALERDKGFHLVRRADRLAVLVAPDEFCHDLDHDGFVRVRKLRALFVETVEEKLREEGLRLEALERKFSHVHPPHGTTMAPGTISTRTSG